LFDGCAIVSAIRFRLIVRGTTMLRASRIILIGLLVCISSLAAAQTPPKPQSRSHGMRVALPAALLQLDDGDTVAIRWSDRDEEIVRILGIDAP
jgi:hypothetical protein